MINKKILVVSGWGPPMIDGPSVILGNLLREFDREKTILFSRKIDRNNTVFYKDGNVLNIKKYSVYVPSPFAANSQNSRRLFRLMETAFIPLTTIKGILVCLKEKVNCILATSDQPHMHFLTTAYCIARIMKKQLVLYLLDPVEEFRLGRIQKMLLKILMPRLLKFASKIFVMSNVLADYYQCKYGVKCEILPHSVGEIKGEYKVLAANLEEKEQTEIVFSGKLSRYQEDSLLNLKRAIEILPQKIKLKIYSSTKLDYLKELGLCGENVTIDHLNHEELKEELNNADILFIPLSFKYSESMVVKAAFPAKTMDYLLARRPILIHAPKDSFIVGYARKNDFAVCIAENDVDLLANAIRNLIVDKDLKVKLIDNCQKTLLQHDSRTVYNKFMKTMGEI